MQLCGPNRADTPKIPGTGGDVIRVKAGTIRWLVRRSALSPLTQQVMRDPDAYLRDSRSLVADSSLITLGRIHPSDTGEPTLLLRRLNYGRLRHRLRDVFRKTRAERAFWHGIGLEIAGVATARVLAAGARRVLRWPIRSYLLTEWLHNTVTVREYIGRRQQSPRELVCMLADLIARLHDQGFSHRDLNASNILLDDRLQPILIDLDGIRKSERLTQRRAVADLTRLAWEFAGYPIFLKWNGQRFLKRYCQKRGMESARKTLGVRIARPIQRRLDAGVTVWKK